MSTRERKFVLMKFVLMISWIIVFCSGNCSGNLFDPKNVKVKFSDIEGYKCNTVNVYTEISNDDSHDVWLFFIANPEPDSVYGEFTRKAFINLTFSPGVTSTVVIGTFHFTSDVICKADNELVKLNFMVDINNDGKYDMPPDEFFEKKGSFNVHVTPAPGAIVLGSIGLSFSGWLLRRRRML